MNDCKTRFSVMASLLMILASVSYGASEDTSEAAQRIMALQLVTKGLAKMMLDAGKLNHIRLPKNAGEEASLKEACAKGPDEFYQWMLGGPAHPTPKDPDNWEIRWKELGKDPFLFCREQENAFQEAVHSKTATKGEKEASLIQSQQADWENLQRVADAHHAKPDPRVRLPRNAKEQAEFNAAARQGLNTCFDWIDPSHLMPDHAAMGTEWTVTNINSAEAQCTEWARRMAYQDAK